MKKFKSIVLVIVLTLCSVFMLIPTHNVQAKTWTKKSLESEMKKTKASINKYQSLQKKSTKGKIYINGKIISTDPFIVENIELFGTTYYWVKNPQNLNILFTLTDGYVKKSGTYKKYNNITCPVVTAVKVKDYSNKISSLQNKYFAMECALKQDIEDVPEKIFLEKEKTYNIYYSWMKPSGSKYSKCTFTSSNPAVATVSKDGRIKAVGEGTSRITIKVSPSGKKHSFPVICSSVADVVFDQEEYTYVQREKKEERESDILINYTLNNEFSIAMYEFVDDQYVSFNDYVVGDGYIGLDIADNAPDSFKIKIRFYDSYSDRIVEVPCTIKRVGKFENDVTNNPNNYEDFNYEDYYGEW